MTGFTMHARTRPASGRVVWVLAALGCLGGAGCAVAAPAAGGPEAPPPEPVLSDERPSRSAEAAAVGLLDQARIAFAGGELARARSAAAEVVDRYPGAPVSGQALRLLVDVAYAEESWREADALAQRYTRLLPEDDARVLALRLLQGEARLRDGDAAAALDRLGAIPVGAPGAALAAALPIVRRAGAALDPAALASRIDALAAGHAFRPVLLAAFARVLYNGGEEARARAAAEAALAEGAADADADLARAVLERRIDEGLGLVGPVTVLGVMLPRTGPPSLTAFAAEVEEGIRAAVEAAALPGRVEVVVRDDGGGAAGAAAAMRQLEEAGAVAVVGPLDEAELAAASAARTRPIPLLSPTSPGTPGGAAHVYTLGEADPGSARALARWAAESGLTRVAVVHPRGGDAEVEALAFETAFRAAGGTVAARFPYPRGTTYFEPQLREIEALRPDAVVLPLAGEDIEILAPQITFFGLDTLGIRVLGTGTWTRAEVLREVAPRHTDGVVATTPDLPGAAEGEGYAALVGAYERLYQRTLRSAVPAVGYDAAALLLGALRTGARSPDAVAAALEALDGFPGATGSLGVEDGRVLRRHHLVCIQEGRLWPVASGERPVMIDRRPPLDEFGERPEYALEGAPIVVVCPGAPVPEGVQVGR